MKFTTETYYTPSGRCVDGEGVIPDYPVEIPEEAYEDGVITDEEDLQTACGSYPLPILYFHHNGFLIRSGN